MSSSARFFGVCLLRPFLIYIFNFLSCFTCLSILTWTNFLGLLDSLELENNGDLENDSNAGRFVRYQFTPHFLKLKTVGATWVWKKTILFFLNYLTKSNLSLKIDVIIILGSLYSKSLMDACAIYRVEFTVGNHPISNFRMIERHYFKDKLLKSFDFEFGFCIPNSCNTCEHIYHFPNLSKSLGKRNCNIDIFILQKADIIWISDKS